MNLANLRTMSILDKWLMSIQNYWLIWTVGKWLAVILSRFSWDSGCWIIEGTVAI